MAKSRFCLARPRQGWWAAALIATVPLYLQVIRPAMLGWGATPDERDARLPGDDIVATPRNLWTRAVTIAAPPAAVWPWLAQIGQGRGGLYSYDWLENLLGCDIHSVDRIIPELQQLAVGDPIRLVREGYPADLVLTVAAILPEQALVLAAPGTRAEALAAGLAYLSWAFILRPTPDGGTRLIVRTRSDFAPTFAGRLVNQVLLEPIQFIMERKMMLGIKARADAEYRTHSRKVADAEK
jgi:hypothetical protein